MSTRLMNSTLLLLTATCLASLANFAQAAPINWRNNLDAAKVEASQSGKLVLLHFYTSTCGPCKKLERDVFSQPQIAAAIERDYVPVIINADQAPALANAYQINRVPAEVVLTPQGNIVQKLSCPMEPNAYGTQLVNVAQYYQQAVGVRQVSSQTPVHSAYAGLKVGQSAASPATPSNAQVTPRGAQPVSTTAVSPAVMQNPYVAFAPPADSVQQQSITSQAAPASRDMGSRYAPIAQQQPVVAASPQQQYAERPATTSPTASTIANSYAAPAQSVAQNWPPQLPAGTPQLAFDGHCPISLRQEKKWVHGNPKIGAIHRGRTYLFASEAQRQSFLANPDAYSPVFSGNDPVKLLDENVEVAGKREFGFEYRNAFYLFSSKESMERFASQPDKYSIGVRQAMNQMDATNGTMRR